MEETDRLWIQNHRLVSTVKDQIILYAVSRSMKVFMVRSLYLWLNLCPKWQLHDMYNISVCDDISLSNSICNLSSGTVCMGDWGRTNLFKGLKVPLNLIPPHRLSPTLWNNFLKKEEKKGDDIFECFLNIWLVGFCFSLYIILVIFTLYV